MILKLKMKDESRKNIEVIKSHFFNASDKITAGYTIGLAVERTNGVSDSEWISAINSVLYENETSGKSTSVSLRQDIFERITQIKGKLQSLCKKSLYMSQVIDAILLIAVNKLNLTLLDLNSLTVMEWNINARSSSMNYIIPVNLISNEVFEKNPHIFVFTEFVKSVGWIDLKTILEEKYYIFDSPYVLRQNGICIGILKGCGIEFLGAETKNSIFSAHLNSPDYYEIKVRINSKEIAVIGTRIRIDYCKAQSKIREERIAEQRQRFEQYSNLINHVAQLDYVIALGDFNNSRIISDEMELDDVKIDGIYSGKDSVEYNFQKIRTFAMKKTDKKMSLYTPDSDSSSVGAGWDDKAKKAKAPNLDKTNKHKYDHVLTNFFPEKLEYKWDFLRFYDLTHFTVEGKIKAGYPDHAILLATINLTSIIDNCQEQSL